MKYWRRSNDQTVRCLIAVTDDCWLRLYLHFIIINDTQSDIKGDLAIDCIAILCDYIDRRN